MLTSFDSTAGYFSPQVSENEGLKSSLKDDSAKGKHLEFHFAAQQKYLLLFDNSVCGTCDEKSCHKISGQFKPASGSCQHLSSKRNGKKNAMKIVTFVTLPNSQTNILMLKLFFFFFLIGVLIKIPVHCPAKYKEIQLFSWSPWSAES